VLFDTDILIAVHRGHRNAASLINKTESRHISVFTYMEFLQGAKDKSHLTLGQAFLRDLGFETIPLSGNIGHRAAIYVEQYALSHAMRAGDAVIAATASEHGLTLATGNAKHYRQIPGLELKILRF
jgi:predicted nucleic acid-binding protein